ncbi:MAG: glycosyltransferase family 1 protein [Bacteroidota bacterium]
MQPSPLASAPLYAHEGAPRGDADAPPPRRIALFTGNYNHIPDGVSLTLNRLVAHLEAQGDEVLVFGPTVDEPPMAHHGTFVPIPSIPAPGRDEYRVSLWFQKEAKRRLEAFRPHLVHIATPDLLGWQALRWAEKNQVPVVGSYHTHFTSYLKYYKLQMLESVVWSYIRRFYGRCEHVYAPSPSVMDALKAHGITRGVRLWARGVDMDRFGPHRRSAAWRAAQGFAPEEVVVAFVGRLVWEKGLDVFADVVQNLERLGVPHRSLVVGDGPAQDALERRLPNTVFTGYLSGTDLATAYASADVFLFPSDTETFGNVTLEAMASGLPTICADATGSRGLVDHGTSGFLVPAGDTTAFTTRTKQLVEDAALRERFGQGALARAQTYSWSAIMNRLVRHYDQVLDLEPVLAGDGAGDGLNVPVPTLARRSRLA